MVYLYTNSTIACYNVSSGLFTEIATGPELSKVCIALISDSIYLIDTVYSTKDQEIQIFNMISNTWDSVSLNFSIHSFACSSFSDSLYLFGGYTEVGLTNELFDYSSQTTNLTILSQNLTYPDPRSYSTLNSLLGSHFLIGGSNKGKFYSDIWTTAYDKLSWQKIDYKGNFIGLSHHCSCIYAGSLIIYGGLSASGLNSKLFKFSFSGEMTEISFSGLAPTARMGSCIVANDSDLFIFGGETKSGYSGELWKFQIGDLSFSLESTYEHGVAYHNCELSGSVLKIMNGRLNDGKYNEFIVEKNLSDIDSDWVHSGPYDNPSSSGIATAFGPVLAKFGGEYYGKVVEIGQIIELSTDEILFNADYSFGLLGSAFTVFNKSIFIYGGKGSRQKLNFPNANSWNFYLIIPELYCNKGMKKSGSICSACPQGTYNDEIDSDTCKKCPKGTYNKNTISRSKFFCLPCPYNKFGPNEGMSECLSCPSFSYCPVGASEPKILYTESAITSINPYLSTSTSKIDTIILDLEIIFVSFGVFAILLFISSKKYRSLAKLTDIFKINHNDKLGVPMILRKTKIGGCFTILFILASICLSIITLLYFFLDNETVSQALVPSASIVKDYPDITGDMSFNLTLVNYGGQCPDNDACEGVLTSNDIEFDSKSVRCQGVDGNCQIIFSCVRCKLGNFPSLKLFIKESRCFASGIDLNITSDSGINNKISSVLVKIKPSSDNNVLIGLLPSIVNIDVIYSVYKDTSELSTGFYVLSNTEPDVGSNCDAADVPLYNTILLNIILNKQNSALLTLISVKVATELILTGLLGGITGVLEIFSIMMDATESSYKFVARKFKSKMKVNKVSKKTEEIRNNFDWKSVLATKKSLWIADSASLTGTQNLELEDF